MSPSPSSNQVVILVPGTLGSELRDDVGDGNVWPGSWTDWTSGYTKINRLRKPNLQVGDIIRKMGFIGFYDHLTDQLNACGYKESVYPQKLYVCPYDWRLPLQTTTTALAQKVALAVAEHGDGVDIFLVAHSLGGLMCRYFLESGDFEPEAYANVSQLVMMGVPNLGLPLMVSLARGDQNHKFLSGQQLKDLMNTNGLSAAYLMFPATSAQKMWQTAGARPLSSYDLFSGTGAADLGLTSATNLGHAKTFRAKLENGHRPSHVRYFSFIGTRHKTYTGATVMNAGTTPKYNLDKTERPDGGDGMVPLWSAWLSGEQGLAVGGAHGRIFKDNTLRATLAVLLGCSPQASIASVAPGPQLDMADLALYPGDPTEIGLRFGKSITFLSGEIEVSRVEEPFEEGAERFARVDRIRLNYEGGPISSLRLEWNAPAETGGYRLRFTDGERDLSATAEFFVQARPEDSGE